MPEATIRKCDKSLQDKNYLQIVKTNKRDEETGCAIREKFYHLTKLEQAIVLQDHEERINSNEEAIKNLQKDNVILLAELKRLSAKLDSQLVM